MSCGVAILAAVIAIAVFPWLATAFDTYMDWVDKKTGRW